MSFTVIDIIIVVALLLAGIKGALSGFMREVFGLLVILASLVVAYFGYETVHGSLLSNLPEEIPAGVVATVAFVVAFLMVWATLNIVTMIAQRFMKFKEASPVGRALGAVISAGKVLVILSFVLAGFQYIPHNPMELRQKVEQSTIGSPLAKMAPIIFQGFTSILPDREGPSPFSGLTQLGELVPDMERLKQEARKIGNSNQDFMRNR